MTPDDEVRAMEIATKLVETLLSWAATSSINSIGAAIVDLWQQVDNVEDIRAVGELLQAMTERDRVAIARGERWGKRSRALSQEEGKKVLRGLTIAQVNALCDRRGYGHAEVMDWAMGYSDIHGEARLLAVLSDRDEMAKITGGER